MEKPYYSKKKKKPAKKQGGLGISIFDYKDPQFLRRFIDSQGQIKNRIANQATAKEQRRLSKAIKRARQIGLLPYQIIEQTLRIKKPEIPQNNPKNSELKEE